MLRRTLCGAMQGADSEQSLKRPRCDSSPRTPQNTRFKAAEGSPDPLPSDHKTWNPEQVCLFLKRSGFEDSALLDRIRGSRARGLRGWGTATRGGNRRPEEGRPRAVSRGPQGGPKAEERDATREAAEGRTEAGAPGRGDLRRRASEKGA